MPDLSIRIEHLSQRFSRHCSQVSHQKFAVQQARCDVVRSVYLEIHKPLLSMAPQMFKGLGADGLGTAGLKAGRDHTVLSAIGHENACFRVGHIWMRFSRWIAADGSLSEGTRAPRSASSWRNYRFIFKGREDNGV